MIPAFVSVARVVALAGSLRVGLATTFSAHGDPGNPDPHAACLGRDLDDARDVGVASRDLPCGARVVVCLPRRGRCVEGRVVDRGPYGRRRDGRFRADLDLTAKMRRRLGHDGYERVVFATGGEEK